MTLKGLSDKLTSTWLGSMLHRSSESLYVSLSRNLFFLILFVGIVPSIMQGMIAYYQCEKTIEREHKDQLVWRMRHTQEEVDCFLEERTANIRFLFESYAVEQFNDQKKLQQIFSKFKKEFPSLVDLGLIDSTGLQNTYSGPYKLLGKNYSDEHWFHEVVVRGSYISDVFLGHRQIPHIAIAIKSSLSPKGELWILRATINAEAFDKMVGAMNSAHEDDTFIINKKGLLQNASRFHGNALHRLSLPMPVASQNIIITEGKNGRNQKVIIAYTSLLKKDWNLVFMRPVSEKQKYLYNLKLKMVGLLIISFIVVFLLAMWITRNFVGRLKDEEQKHDAILQNVEHTTKLASIGRLAAGVAHEINNPMAIINEKAGLMKDLIELSDDFADKKKFLDLLLSIHSSVKRCRTITHRLLGFARQMDVSPEVININDIIHEVLCFVENEALHRDVSIDLDLMKDLPVIKSDRGQLQQVFLNVINNAMDSVGDEGEIAISTWIIDDDVVGVKIHDNGCGIPPDKLKRIFEPFFTTKDRGKGTGLGLSITYGIIKKLGGKLTVESEVNKGTTFIIKLPRKSALS